MERATLQVMSSRGLKGLLRIAMKVGNYINYGTSRMVGETMGVRIKTIMQFQVSIICLYVI